MPRYSYKFDLTQSTFTLPSSNGSVSSSGWDISEFDNDPRGTARHADWSDLGTMLASDFDDLALTLGFTSPAILGWISYSSYSPKINNFLRSTSRAFYATIGVGGDYDTSGGYHNTRLITSNPYRNLKVGSFYTTTRALVYFSNYQANGGHSTLIVNNNKIVNWVSSNNRFESADGNVLLFHNASTWVINDNGTQSTASYDSSDVESYVDPSSVDLVWQNSASVETPSTYAEGDPHIKPIFGKPYTI